MTFSEFIFVLFQSSSTENEEISPLNFLFKCFHPIYAGNRFAHRPVKDVIGTTFDLLLSWTTKDRPRSIYYPEAV